MPEQNPPVEKNTRKQRAWPTGLIVRLFAYFVAGHILAGFLYLLFEIAPKS